MRTQRPAPSSDLNAREQAQADAVFRLLLDNFGIERGVLESRSKPSTVATVRRWGMYLMREIYGWSLPRIGYLFGNRDHATVAYSLRKVSWKIATGIEYDDLYSELRGKLANGLRAEVEGCEPLSGAADAVRGCAGEVSAQMAPKSAVAAPGRAEIICQGSPAQKPCEALRHTDVANTPVSPVCGDELYSLDWADSDLGAGATLIPTAGASGLSKNTAPASSRTR
jgi:hypothetical protein